MKGRFRVGHRILDHHHPQERGHFPGVGQVWDRGRLAHPSFSLLDFEFVAQPHGTNNMLDSASGMANSGTRK
jgi:hypothetical protein